MPRVRQGNSEEAEWLLAPRTKWNITNFLVTPIGLKGYVDTAPQTSRTEQSIEPDTVSGLAPDLIVNSLQVSDFHFWSASVCRFKVTPGPPLGLFFGQIEQESRAHISRFGE